MSRLITVNIVLNKELKQIVKDYCLYVNYLNDFLFPNDFDTLDLLLKPYSKLRAQLNYILKPLRQNSNLNKSFLRLAERRSLKLLRNSCIRLKKKFVKYNKEVLVFSETLKPPVYLEKLDLNDHVARVDKKSLFIMFRDSKVSCAIEKEIPNFKPLLIDSLESKLFLLVPHKRFMQGTQSGNRLKSLCHS